MLTKYVKLAFMPLATPCSLLDIINSHCHSPLLQHAFVNQPAPYAVCLDPIKSFAYT